ncbi:MAG: aspartate aminotransferase family protein, partial [Chloroflexota bacterium]
MSLEEEFKKRLPSSEKLFRRALRVLPDGLTHEVYYMRPYPPFMEKAAGARKWDLDSNEYIDYWMGHGSLLLGHCYPDVVQAVREQVGKGTHYGSCYPLEVEWAELVTSMVPSAKMIRFTASGTEAVMLAVKLARAFTGKDKVIKLEGGFHGWSDYAQIGGGLTPPYDVPASSGIPQEVRNTVLLARPGDAEAALELLRRHHDVACVLVEPGGGLVGRLPSSREYLGRLRWMTQKYGVVLIFDEVVTGFRYAPGGCQEYWGVLPDLTCLGKVMAGGMPGAGAVAGNREIMSFLSRKGDIEWDRYRRVEHHGTFNAAPATVAAGVATLRVIKSGAAIPEADRLADRLRHGLNEVFRTHGVRCCMYGRSSLVLPLLNHDCELFPQCERAVCSLDYRLINRFDPEVHASLRERMLLQGIDFFPVAMFLSFAHSDDDVERTVQAWDNTVKAMK